MTETPDRLPQAPTQPRDISGWLVLGALALMAVSMGFAIWGPKQRRVLPLDHVAMCARHDMTFRPARRGPDFCMKEDGSLYDFGQVTRTDTPIYRN